jgi:hypothetical protein
VVVIVAVASSPSSVVVLISKINCMSPALSVGPLAFISPGIHFIVIHPNEGFTNTVTLQG